jgi:hypothetical protein
VSLSMRYRCHISSTAILHSKSMAFGSTTHVSVKKWPSFSRGYFTTPIFVFLVLEPDLTSCSNMQFQHSIQQVVNLGM